MTTVTTLYGKTWNVGDEIEVRYRWMNKNLKGTITEFSPSGRFFRVSCKPNEYYKCSNGELRGYGGGYVIVTKSVK